MKTKLNILIALSLFVITAGIFISSDKLGWPPSLSLSNAGSNDIVITARGTNGAESIALYINDQPIEFWSLTTNFQDYTYAPPHQITVSKLSVEFLNDRWEPEKNIDYDVQIDKITVNDIEYQSEHSSTLSTGSRELVCSGKQTNRMASL